MEKWITILISAMVCVATANHLSGRPVKSQLDDVLFHFSQTHEFESAQLAVLQGARLVYAESRDPSPPSQASTTAANLLPLLDLSKTITAVAVLQLVERALISFETRVFGDNGVLAFLQPLSENASVDARLYDVTIEHLLRHCAGWDERTGPVMDPTMNRALLALGHKVPDIAMETERGELLDQYDVIQYMLTQPLDFTPGDHIAPSNFGYLVLGRVIEVMTEMTYEDYVKEHILEPAGMWHTRLGDDSQMSAFSKELLLSQAKGEGEEGGKVLPVHDFLSAAMLDSALGWYSNMYDVARFFSALYSEEEGDGTLIRRVTRDYALQRNAQLAKHQRHKWAALGLTVHADGSLTMEASEPLLGANVFVYKEPMAGPFNDPSLDRYLRDTNTIVIFLGRTRKHNKHFYGLHDSILTLNLHLLNQNAYIRDLCDMELITDASNALLKSEIDEHRIVAYTNAMKRAGYHPVWLHGYLHAGRTRYLATFAKASHPLQLQFQLIKSLSRAKIYRQVAAYAKREHQVLLVQSVRSGAHDNALLHTVLMSRAQKQRPTMFNFNTNFSIYQTQLPFHIMEGYQPSMHSIDRAASTTGSGSGLYVSYILHKSADWGEQLPSTRSFVGLTLAELREKVPVLTSSGYSVKYIDSYPDPPAEGEAPAAPSAVHKFSLIVEQVRREGSEFETDIAQADLLTAAYEKAKQNLLPTLAAAHTGADGKLYFAVSWNRV